MGKKKFFIAGALMALVGATVVESVRRYTIDHPSSLDDIDIESALPVEVRLDGSDKWKPAKLFLGRKLNMSKVLVIGYDDKYLMYTVKHVTGCIPGTESITLSFDDSFGINRCLSIRFEDYEPEYEINTIKDFCSTLE